MGEDLESARAQLAKAEQDLERLRYCLGNARDVAHQIAYNQRLAEMQEAVAGAWKHLNKTEEKSNEEKTYSQAAQQTIPLYVARR